MNMTLLLWPIAIHALVTLVLYLPMSRERVRAVREGRAKPSEFRLNTNEPAESQLFLNAIRNQNETGPIFYAACLTAFVTGSASYLIAGLAWAFVVLKMMHLFIHVTSNRVRYRRPMFMASFAVLIVLWVAIMAQLAGIL